MTVEVGMEVHPKRSQIAVVDAAGDQQRNRNLANDPVKLVPVLGVLAPGTPVAFAAAEGWAGWWSCWRNWSWNRTWSTQPLYGDRSARLNNDKVDACPLAPLLWVDLLPRPGRPAGDR